MQKKMLQNREIETLFRVVLGGIFTDNRQDRSGVRGRGKLKGHT